MPWSVNTSSSMACFLRPSMMCALATPPRSAFRQHFTLGNMPPAMVPSSIICRARPLSIVLMSCLSRSQTPSTSVSRTSFSAFRAAATSPATMSALML